MQLQVGTRVVDKSYIYPVQPTYIAPDSELFASLDNDSRYVAELKKNGWRCMVRVGEDKKIALWTRRGTIIGDPLPNLRKALESLKLPPDTILDGELLEHRSVVKEQVVLWGAIRMGGKWLSAMPYKEVLDVMKKIVKESDYIKRTRQVVADKKKFYASAIGGEQGTDNEGLVVKHLDSPVPFGWRNCPTHPLWFKVKPNVLCDGYFAKWR